MSHALPVLCLLVCLTAAAPLAAEDAAQPVGAVLELPRLPLPATAGQPLLASLPAASLDFSLTTGVRDDARAPAAAAPAQPFRVGPPEEAGSRRAWLVLAAAQHSAATFDAWSTRRVVSRGYGRETNPLLRPFADSPALYGAIQAGPLVTNYLGHRMRTSERGWVRRIWWLPQVAGTAVHIWAGKHNLGVMRDAQR